MRTVVHGNTPDGKPLVDTDTPEAFDPLAVHIPARPTAKEPASELSPAQAQQVTEPNDPTNKDLLDEGDDQEETTLCEKDSSYFAVHHMLPTQMAFYDYSKISIRPYRMAEKFKLGAATKSGQIRYIVEAVAACIDRPIMSLALMDFWFLCHWLRTQSYTKTPFTINWACEDRAHLTTVLLGEVEEKTRVNQTVIQHSDIRVKPLDLQRLSKLAADLHEDGLYLHAPTVADFLEKLEQGAEWTPEFSFKADISVFLRADKHGKTLAKRNDVLTKLGNKPQGESAIGALLEASKLLEQGGLEESVGAQCAHCRVHQQVSLEVDLLTFFPFGI